MKKNTENLEKPRLGRPKKDASERKTDYLDVRFTPLEMQKIREIAAKHGGLSAWVRKRLGL